MPEEARPLKRCAIYTRKSTNRLLDRDVNSLTTQREICSAYIKSQQYRGWVELPDDYDDGGHSGSGLERPALARLMRDIEAGQVDSVVIYKIDRLTRSLLDFVRLIEMFDRRHIALVSVSQAFDTSDSMGRMILNVLLTFSQFERELIAERVRDSIRTRKRHGKIHGGLPPFGYVSTPEGLQVDDAEAAIVRFIFAEFLRTRRYTAVMTAVREARMCSSVKYSKLGVPRGGTLLSPSSVHQMLRSPIYVGEIRGHDRTYPGRHQPLISREVWEQAKAISAERQKREPQTKQTNHFLAGLLWDDLGRHMILEIDWHRDKPYYTYSSSNAMWSQVEFRRAYRSNAANLDRLIITAFAEFLCDRKKLRAALKTMGIFDDELEILAQAGQGAALRLEATPPEQMRDVFIALLHRIELSEDNVVLDFRMIELRRYLQWTEKGAFLGRPADWPCSDARYLLEIPVCAISAERWPVVHIAPRDASKSGKLDKGLVNLLARARQAQRLVEENREVRVEELAAQLRCRPGHFSRLIRLNYLAPDIVTAILDGTQPAGLNRDVLLKANLPMDWQLQRRLLGFDAPARKIAERNLFGRGVWPGNSPTKMD